MKKKITAIALAVCILVIGIIGATMAYFTDTETKANTFTFGKVNISLTETSEADEAAGVLAGTPKDDGSGYTFDKIVPGQVYSKVPVVKVDNNSPECWLVATVTVSNRDLFYEIYKDNRDVNHGTWLSLAGNAKLVSGGISDFTATPGIFNGMSGTMLNDGTIDVAFIQYSEDAELDTITYTYYFVNKQIGGETYELFTKVYIPKGLQQEMLDTDGDGEVDITSLDMVVKAYAVQDDGFKNVCEAYKAAFTDNTTTVKADEISAAVAAAEDGQTIELVGDVALTGALTVDKDVTIDGNGIATISKQATYLGTENVVTFKNVNFDDTTAGKDASSVYGNGFKGTVIFDGCTFGKNNWEAIQIAPAGDCTVIIKNCTFDGADGVKRFIHIQPASGNDYQLRITVVNNTFKNCDKVNYGTSGINLGTVADFDYIAAGSTLTLGGNTFDKTGRIPYFYDAAGANELYGAGLQAMLEGAVTTYTVTAAGLE